MCVPVFLGNRHTTISLITDADYPDVEETKFEWPGNSGHQEKYPKEWLKDWGDGRGEWEGSSCIGKSLVRMKRGVCWKEFIFIQELLVLKYDSTEMYLTISRKGLGLLFHVFSAHRMHSSALFLLALNTRTQWHLPCQDHPDACTFCSSQIRYNTLKSKMAWLSPQARILQLDTVW